MSRRRFRLASVALSLLMLPVAAVVALPFYYIVVNTLKPQREAGRDPFGLPSGLYLDNYVEVFQSVPLLQTFLNTVYITATSVAITLLVGSMAAYGMVLRSSWLTKIVGGLLVIAFLVPFQTTLLPLYRMFAGVGLIDTREALIVIGAGGAVFAYLLIVGYMRTVPIEIIEAARIDGAGAFRVYWQIVLPLVRPILITVGVFQVMWIWNDFITPSVFITSPENSTLVLQVYRAVGEFTTDWPLFMTLTVIVLIPMVVFFIAAQRWIVSGLVGGSVKG